MRLELTKHRSKLRAYHTLFDVCVSVWKKLIHPHPPYGVLDHRRTHLLCDWLASPLGTFFFFLRLALIFIHSFILLADAEYSHFPVVIAHKSIVIIRRSFNTGKHIWIGWEQSYLCVRQREREKGGWQSSKWASSLNALKKHWVSLQITRLVHALRFEMVRVEMSSNNNMSEMWHICPFLLLLSLYNSFTRDKNNRWHVSFHFRSHYALCFPASRLAVRLW